MSPGEPATSRPAPMTPADCDLRGLPFMPLDTARLLDSDLFALSTGPEFKSAVALWCKSWQQVPAGSLPNDDRILAHLSGAGARWRKVRAMAMRGFVLCADGRLYHPVVADKAIEAWNHRTAQRDRANKRWRESRGSAAAAPAAPADAHATACAGGSAAALQGTGTGTGTGSDGASHLSGGTPPDLAGPRRATEKKPNGRDLAADAREVIAFLNERAGKRFPYTDSNVGVIVARFREGFDKRQARQVVAMKVRAWKGDEKMAEYLRPMTLFGRQKFSSYVGELVEIVDDEPGIERDREAEGYENQQSGGRQ